MKKILSDDDLSNRYKNLKKYYLSLPYNIKKVKISEKIYKLYAVFFYFISFLKRVRVIGKDKVPNENGIIFVCNHIGSLDQFYIPRLLGLRPLHYLVKEKVKSWFIRWNLIYKSSGVIIVNQESIESWLNAKYEIIKLLLHKKDVFIFPEGTRRGENNIGEFSTGVAQIAQEAEAKIFTLAIKNSHKFFSKKPIVCAGSLIEISQREDLKEATEKIKSEVLKAYKNIAESELK